MDPFILGHYMTSVSARNILLWQAATAKKKKKSHKRTKHSEINHPIHFLNTDAVVRYSTYKAQFCD